MPCNHETIRCTDNVFYCCTCGAVLDVTPVPDKIPVQEEKPVEEAQKPPKRNAKKGGKANA